MCLRCDCRSFYKQKWRSDICRECFHSQQDHYVISPPTPTPSLRAEHRVSLCDVKKHVEQFERVASGKLDANNTIKREKSGVTRKPKRVLVKKKSKAYEKSSEASKDSDSEQEDLEAKQARRVKIQQHFKIQRREKDPVPESKSNKDQNHLSPSSDHHEPQSSMNHQTNLLKTESQEDHPPLSSSIQSSDNDLLPSLPSPTATGEESCSASSTSVLGNAVSNPNSPLTVRRSSKNITLDDDGDEAILFRRAKSTQQDQHLTKPPRPLSLAPLKAPPIPEELLPSGLGKS
jgi:hypothetical protein